MIDEKEPDSPSEITEVDISDFKKSENHNSGSRKSGILEVGKPYPNNTNINNTDISDTNHINQSEKDDEISYESYKEFIKENIDYEYLMQDYSDSDMELIDTMVELMAEVAVTGGDTISISGQSVPKTIVVSRFEKYDMMTIQYVMGCLHENTSDIKNIKKYLLATLYNAPVTMGAYYKQMANRCLYGMGS